MFTWFWFLKTKKETSVFYCIYWSVYLSIISPPVCFLPNTWIYQFQRIAIDVSHHSRCLVVAAHLWCDDCLMSSDAGFSACIYMQSWWDWLFRAGCPLCNTQPACKSRQSVRGHIRSRKQPCLPRLSLLEWWLLWSVSFFCFLFCLVEYLWDVAAPYLARLSFSVRQRRYADSDGHVHRGCLPCLEIHRNNWQYTWMRVDNAAENENNAVCQARNTPCHCQPLGMLGLLDRLGPAFFFFFFLKAL